MMERPFRVRAREGLDQNGRATIKIDFEILPAIVLRYINSRVAHFSEQGTLRHLRCLRRLDASQLRRGRPLESLTKDDVESFLDDCRGSNLLDYCCLIYTDPQQCGGVGTGFANFLADEGLISAQELERIRVYVTAKKREGKRRMQESEKHSSKRRSALNDRQLRAFKLHADRMVRMMIDFTLDFLTRVYEGVCSVMLDDIDFNTKEITFYIKPRRKKHVLPFDEKDEKFLRQIIWFREIYAGQKLGDRSGSRFLFVTRTGLRWTGGNAQNIVGDMREEIRNCTEHSECREITGQNKLHLISWHMLRYTGARRAYEKTGSIIYVRDLLGHRSVKQTERYLNLDEEEKLKGLRKGLEQRRRSCLASGISDRYS
jgi:integrase